MDRTVLGILAPTLSDELHWSEVDYANIVSWFSFAYAFGYLLMGRLNDRIGVRKGYAFSIFGWSAADMLGKTFGGWRHIYEDDEPVASRMILGLVEGRSRHATLRHRNYRKDGSVIWVEWHNSALRDPGGRVISILSLAQDVSSRIQAEERLQQVVEQSREL